jgi:hypothetical protein
MRRKILGKRPNPIMNRAIYLGAKLYNQCRVAQWYELKRTACVTMLVRGVMQSQFTSPYVVNPSSRPTAALSQTHSTHATVTVVNFVIDALRPEHLSDVKAMVKGVICGVRVEDIEEPTMREIRYLDKLVDELAKGKALGKILWQPADE